jgi:hypothetical protein
MTSNEKAARTLEETMALYVTILQNKPKNATGLYITSQGISFGYRSNREKAPKNYFFFNSLKEENE